jgi:pimeloyl-ACP methyl ester carboxylesterase
MGDPSGKWMQVEVAGKRCDLFEPARPGPFVLIFLHGVGGETLATNQIYTAQLERHALTCICPHGKRSWWTNRICPEFDSALTVEQHLLDHVLSYVESRWGAAPPAVGLCGISMGGQGAIRLGFRFPSKFQVVAAISAAIDFHRWYGHGTPLDEMYADRESARQDTAPLYLHPLNWPRHLFFAIDPTDDWLDSNRRLHEKLAAMGIAHTCDLTTRAGGHSWDYFNAMAEPAIDFVVRGLETESRRVR